MEPTSVNCTSHNFQNSPSLTPTFNVSPKPVRLCLRCLSNHPLLSTSPSFPCGVITMVSSGPNSSPSTLLSSSNALLYSNHSHHLRKRPILTQSPFHKTPQNPYFSTIHFLVHFCLFASQPAKTKPTTFTASSLSSPLNKIT